MTTNDFVKPTEKLESVDPKAAPLEKTCRHAGIYDAFE